MGFHYILNPPRTCSITSQFEICKNDHVCRIESMAFNIFGIPLNDEKCFLVYRYINFHRSFYDLLYGRFCWTFI